MLGNEFLAASKLFCNKWRNNISELIPRSLKTQFKQKFTTAFSSFSSCTCVISVVVLPFLYCKHIQLNFSACPSLIYNKIQMCLKRGEWRNLLICKLYFSAQFLAKKRLEQTWQQSEHSRHWYILIWTACLYTFWQEGSVIRAER